MEKALYKCTTLLTVGQNYIWYGSDFIVLGPVVQSSISANPGLTVY